jgi:hypothetical protein
VLNRPLNYIDPSGHQDEDPLKKEFEKSICERSPQLCQPQGGLVQNGNNQLKVDLAPTEIQIGPAGTITAKSSGGLGKKIRDFGDKVGMALGGCKGLAAILCSEAARRAAEAINHDGDPTNELTSLAQSGAKVSSDLAPAMRKWFGNGVENLEKNPDIRPIWVTDVQLLKYKQIAEDAIEKYNKMARPSVEGLRVQRIRLDAIIRELRLRDIERSSGSLEA